ncbi:hypothetical protein [Oenococcus oeni]|uniref:hypothetical protein n=2 Tax=Oenococcus oeni TaxID=1247 RepID=UPI000BDF76E7|nr:hypothetical protein [Oenococcus oeni]PDH92511.1 hypothetical protein AO466_06640 [Oenococcus oeni]
MDDLNFTIINLHEKLADMPDCLVTKNSLSDLYDEVQKNKIVLIDVISDYANDQMITRKMLLDSNLIADAHELTAAEAIAWMQNVRETIGYTEK